LLIDMTIKPTRLQLLAPAKVNLSLRIECRRPDGFHELETFICPIALYDELEIARAEAGVEFSCDDPSVPAGDDNLVVRAANAFFATTGHTGISIRLTKKIPHGAGLGGGSSDAASTLLGLDQLFGTNMPREALAEMAEALGSDVPFFIFQSSALCGGRGELITPQRLPEKFCLMLFKPQFSVSTPFAYSRWKDSAQIPEIRYEAQEYHGHTFINDLERPVFEKYVFLARLKTWLLGQPEVAVALMSGSGSTIFAIMKDPDAADEIADRAKQELDPNLWIHACMTV
jgi:4-diphosphocytidyl-2-C-methyl-D-erythritol kinase